YLPMGARCGVRRAYPVELADRRGAARDPGALVVLTRARFGSRHVATLTHSRVAATLRRVCRRGSAWPERSRRGGSFRRTLPRRLRGRRTGREGRPARFC